MMYNDNILLLNDFTVLHEYNTIEEHDIDKYLKDDEIINAVCLKGDGDETENKEEEA